MAGPYVKFYGSEQVFGYYSYIRKGGKCKPPELYGNTKEYLLKNM